MKKKSLKIVFMGTPDFAVPSLDILNENFDVVGVITSPDRKAGRGQKIRYSAVKEFALKEQLPLLQPTNLKAEDFISELQSLEADIQVVVAFRMLPEVVWNMPPLGTINLHGSLLPQYRGAAPINWAIINGEQVTGVTTFFIEKEIDTGNIIMRKEIEILPDENAGELHDKMMIIGASALLETVEMIQEKGKDLKTLDQDHWNEILKKAPKIFKEDCLIDWNKTQDEVHNFIRGLSPYPAAWCKIDDKSFKVYNGIKSEIKAEKPGDLFIDEEGNLFVSCKDFQYQILELQMEGKKRMSTTDFLRGYTFSSNKN